MVCGLCPQFCGIIPVCGHFLFGLVTGQFWIGIPLPCGPFGSFSASFIGNSIVTFLPISFSHGLASAIVNYRARIESALSISSYCDPASSSVVSYVCTEHVEGGALSLPLMEAIPLCIAGMCGGEDGDPREFLSTSISINLFYGLAFMLLASSIMFGVDLVGVADIAGVGPANASLQAWCGLRR